MRCNLTEAECMESLSLPASSNKNPFPYQVTAGGHFCCGPSYFTERDGGQDSLLLYTCKGCGQIMYREAALSLPAGTMVLLDGKYAHRYETSGREKWELLWLHYRELSPVSVADYLFERKVLLQQVPLQEANSFYRSCDAVSSENLQMGSMQLSQLLSSFLIKWGIYNYNRQFPVAKSREKLIHKAQEYMRDHLAAEVTLDELSAFCAVSKYYLIKLFRRTVGMTPHQYLLHLRISQAKFLLLSTADTVASIGEAVGFSNTSSFIAVFKRIEGTTPLGVRNAKP